jgi:hypothetical protein
MIRIKSHMTRKVRKHFLRIGWLCRLHLASRCTDRNINTDIITFCFFIYFMSLMFWLPPRGRFRNRNPLFYFHWPPHFLPQWFPYFLLPPFLEPSCLPHSTCPPHAMWPMWIANRYVDHTEIFKYTKIMLSTQSSHGLSQNKHMWTTDFWIN